jgi:hypothetical protein
MQGSVGIRELGGIQPVLRSIGLRHRGIPLSGARFGRWMKCAPRRDPGSWGLAFAGHFTRWKEATCESGQRVSWGSALR